MWRRRKSATQIQLEKQVALVNAYCDLIDAYMKYVDAELAVIAIQKEIVDNQIARLKFGSDLEGRMF